MVAMQNAEAWAREQEWDLFLSTLSIWETRWLCNGGMELILHDRFLSGEIDLAAVEAQLGAAFAHA